MRMLRCFICLRCVTETLYAWNDDSWNLRSAVWINPELSPKMTWPPPLVHAVMSSAYNTHARRPREG